VILRAWEVVALAEAGPRARLSGRWERGSADVGMLSGIGSDIVSNVSDCARSQRTTQDRDMSSTSWVRKRVDRRFSRFACSRDPKLDGPGLISRRGRRAKSRMVWNLSRRRKHEIGVTGKLGLPQGYYTTCTSISSGREQSASSVTAAS
jgi:hypothetical protein